MDTFHAESSLAYQGFQPYYTYTNGTDICSGMAQTDEVKSLIRIFLEDINFDRRAPFIKDLRLETAVWQYFKGLGLGEETEKSVQRTLKLSVTFTHQAYTALPFEIRVICAIQFLYMFLVDDIADTFMADLEAFGQK